MNFETRKFNVGDVWHVWDKGLPQEAEVVKVKTSGRIVVKFLETKIKQEVDSMDLLVKKGT